MAGDTLDIFFILAGLICESVHRDFRHGGLLVRHYNLSGDDMERLPMSYIYVV